jgi:tRNA(Met) C34 N-acetyltransferase TmcA
MKVGMTAFVMPVLVLVAGAFLLARPAFLGTAVGTVAGAALIVYGVSEFLSSWKMRKAMDEYEIHQTKTEDAKPDDIPSVQVKDVDYEKVDEQ